MGRIFKRICPLISAPLIAAALLFACAVPQQTQGQRPAYGAYGPYGARRAGPARAATPIPTPTPIRNFATRPRAGQTRLVASIAKAQSGLLTLAFLREELAEESIQILKLTPLRKDTAPTVSTVSPNVAVEVTTSEPSPETLSSGLEVADAPQLKIPESLLAVADQFTSTVVTIPKLKWVPTDLPTNDELLADLTVRVDGEEVEISPLDEPGHFLLDLRESLIAKQSNDMVQIEIVQGSKKSVLLRRSYGVRTFSGSDR